VVQLSYESHLPSLKVVMCCVHICVVACGEREERQWHLLHGLWYGRKLHYWCHATPLLKISITRKHVATTDCEPGGVQSCMTPLQMYLSVCACFILEDRLSLNISKQLATRAA